MLFSFQLQVQTIPVAHRKQHKLEELQKNVVCLLTSDPLGSKKTNWKNLQGNVVLGFNFRFRIIDGSQENNINWKN